MKPIIGITMGDPGIGPEIAVKALAKSKFMKNAYPLL